MNIQIQLRREEGMDENIGSYKIKKGGTKRWTWIIRRRGGESAISSPFPSVAAADEAA